MFQGPSNLSLDAKGRLSVPTRHRDVLLATASGQLTITRHPHGCLLIYPRPFWEPLRERLAALTMKDDRVRRLLLGSAMDVEMDATGRILIPPELRAATHIVRDTLLLGLGKHFELWDKAKHDAQEAEALANGLTVEMQDFAL